MRCVANRLAFLLLPTSLLLAAHAARAEPVALEALERQALHERGAVAAARARVDGAEARILQAKAPYYPTLAAKAGASLAPGGRIVEVDGYYVAGSKALGSRGAFEPLFRYDASVSLASRLYDFGRTAASVRAARAEREAAVAGADAERHGVVVEVRDAYLDWVSAQATRAILARSAADASALRASLEAHVAEGARPGAELASARYDEARAALDLERAESDLAAARLEVEQASGVTLSQTAEPDLTLLDRPAPTAAAPADPAVRALERRRDAALASAEAHASPHRPILAAAADAGVHGQMSTPFPLYQVGVSLTVPLFDGGVEAASAAEASAQAKELAAEATDARRRAALERRHAELLLARSERRLALAERLVAAAEESVKHAEDQRELGVATFDAVVEAKVQVSRAELEVLGARLERARAVLALTPSAAP